MSERNVELVEWAEGKALYVDGNRVAGGKPWGGGISTMDFSFQDARLEKAEKEVERLRGELDEERRRRRNATAAATLAQELLTKHSVPGFEREAKND